MSTIRWVGGAEKKSKVINYTFAGTWVIGEIVTFTIGVKQFRYTLTSTTIATFLPLMVTAYNALSATDYAEMAEITASATSPEFNLTADTAGKPFTCTISTDSAAGTIEGVAAPNSSSAGTTTTANNGPQSLLSVKNYSGGALPVNGDTLVFDFNDDEILYDLDALSAVTLLVLRIESSFVGTIGMPEDNEDATSYPEYRPKYMAVGATTAIIGDGADEGSSMLKIDFGAVQTLCNVHQSQDGEDDLPAVMLKGTHASNAFHFTRNSVSGLGIFGGDATTYLTLTMENDAKLLIGSGVTGGTVTKFGGYLESNSAIATALNHEGGECDLNGTGAIASLQIKGGTVRYNTSGTLGGNTLVADGVLDFNWDPRSKTVTNPIDVYGAGVVLDDNKVVAALIVDYNNLAVPGLGRNVRVTRGTPA